MLSQAELETEGSGLATIFGLPPAPHGASGEEAHAPTHSPTTPDFC